MAKKCVNGNRGKPILTRPLGRPKNRWEDDIQDRKNWKLYVEKVKLPTIEVVVPIE
jgi:hypothetical protein